MNPKSTKDLQTRLNRNWVRPPNIIIRKSSSNLPQKLSYWTDSDKHVQLYTKEELAICNILTNLNQILTKSLILADVLKSLDQDTKVSDLFNQDYAKFDAKDSSVFNHFITLVSAVPDITFGEFLGFISTSNLFCFLGCSF